MSEYKLKPGKVGKTVMGAYKKVEDAFMDAFLERDESGDGALHLKTGRAGEAAVKGYRKVEDAVVGTYKKVEDAFVDAFLEKVEPAEDTTEPEATDAESADKPDQA